MSRDDSGGRPVGGTITPRGRAVPPPPRMEGDGFAPGSSLANAGEGDDDGFAPGPPLADETTPPPVASCPTGTASAVPVRGGLYEEDALTTAALRLPPTEGDAALPDLEADEDEEPRGWRLRGSARDLGAAAVRGGVLEVVSVEDVARRLEIVLEPFEQLLLRAAQIDADQERMTRDLRTAAAEVRAEGGKFLEGLAAARRLASRESAAVTDLLGRTRETSVAAGSEAAALLAALRACAEEARTLGPAAGEAREIIEREMGTFARRALRWYLVGLAVTLCVTAVFVFALLWVVARG